MRGNRMLALWLSLVMLLPAAGVFGEETEHGRNAAQALYERGKEPAAVLQALRVLPEGYLTSENAGEAITRVEFVTLLLKLIGMSSGQAAPGMEESAGSELALGNTYDNWIFNDGGAGAGAHTPGKPAKPVVYFTDIAPDHESYPDITTAVGLGIVSGYSDRTFRPGETVGAAQAVKMLVTAARYGYQAESLGGYPTGYWQTAAQLRMLRGFGKAGEETVSRGDAALLLYNTLSVKYVRVSGIGGQDYTFEKESSIMRECLGVEAAEGVVSGNGHTRLLSQNGVGRGNVLIGSETYRTGRTKASDLLGYHTRFYYIADERSSAYNTIVYIALSENKNEVLHIEKKDFISYENKELAYADENERVQRAEMKAASVIYNGRLVTDYTGVFDIRSGDIRLIDNNADGNYDVVIVFDYETVSVSSVDKSQRMVYNKLKNAAAVSLDEERFGTVVITDTDGNPLPFGDIRENHIISYAKSRDDGYVKAIVSDNTFSGTVEEVLLSGREASVKVGGETVPLSERLPQTDDLAALTGVEKAAVGAAYNFYLDHQNRIAYYERSAGFSGAKFGWIIEGALRGNLHKHLSLRLFSQDGKIAAYDAREKVKINGKVYQSAQEAYNILQQRNYLAMNIPGGVNDGTVPVVAHIRQLVLYELDGEGYLQSVDSAYVPQIGASRESGESLDSLHYMYQLEGDAENFQYAQRMAFTFGNRVGMNDKTIVFEVPDDEIYLNNERQYSVSDRMTFNTNEKYYRVSTYAVRSDAVIADVIVKLNAGGSAGANPDTRIPINVGVIDKITRALDEDGGEVSRITLYPYTGYNSTTGEIKSYLLTNEDVLYNLSGEMENIVEGGVVVGQRPKELLDSNNDPIRLSPGDVISFLIDGGGRINALRLQFDASDQREKSTAPNSSPRYTDGNRFAYGHLAARQSDMLRVDLLNKLGSEPDYEVLSMARTKLKLLVELQGGKVTISPLNLSEIPLYRDSDPETDRYRVLYYQTYASMDVIVVYKLFD